MWYDKIVHVILQLGLNAYLVFATAIDFIFLLKIQKNHATKSNLIASLVMDENALKKKKFAMEYRTVQME